MDLLFTKLVITLRADSACRNPYVLFAVKSRFRIAFRETVCRADGHCSLCSQQRECSFYAVFSQDLTDDPVALKRHQKPPLPFIFHVPLLPECGSSGGPLEVGLVIVGAAMNYLPEFRSAILRLFRPDQWQEIPSLELVSIESEGCSGFRSLVSAGQESSSLVGIATISADDLLALNTLSSDQVGLRFITPLRIQNDGCLLRSFSFSPFIRTLLRRISSIAYYYYGSVPEMDFSRLAGLSGAIDVSGCTMQWVEWKKGPLEGVIGSGILCGDAEDFHPVLLLGEYLSCGKGAAYGLGRYELFQCPEQEGAD